MVINCYAKLLTDKHIDRQTNKQTDKRRVLVLHNIKHMNVHTISSYKSSDFKH